MMFVFQLNVDGFFIITFKILKVENKTPMVRANDRLYSLRFNTSKMKA